LSLFVDTIRNAALDVLFYPDLGLDPIPYFAAFSRLAPIQITGLGHQDTSGISTIDYFISDELDPPGHEAFYTEKLIRMPGMGTCFYDRFISYASQLQNPRTGILERAKYIESIGNTVRLPLISSSLPSPFLLRCRRYPPCLSCLYHRPTSLCSPSFL
jgi:predicted O-linked N-acetylglucosamine transferase (SPINDLY family)